MRVWLTNLANDSEVVIKKQNVSVLCSAWVIKSAATKFGSAELSAIIPISVGPASISIDVVLLTSDFARVTKEPPGPTILSTFLIVLVPNERAAIAFAPPVF